MEVLHGRFIRVFEVALDELADDRWLADAGVAQKNDLVGIADLHFGFCSNIRSIEKISDGTKALKKVFTKNKWISELYSKNKKQKSERKRHSWKTF